MWIFADFGTMMPALIPPSVLETSKASEIKQARERGWDIQVRGRVREHLEYFAANYMPQGSYSKVYESRNKDYNVRLYTDKASFAEGLANVALDIDYVKFKDTAKRYTWGKKYYDLLIKVWSASTILARPYDGERPGSGWSSSYRKPKRGKKSNYPQRGQTGSTFFFDDEPDDSDLDDWWNYSSTSSRTSRSIHDMTDKELEEIEALY